MEHEAGSTVKKEKIVKYEFRLTTPPSVNALYKSRFNPKTFKSSFYIDPKARAAKELLEKELNSYRRLNNCPKFKDTIIICEVTFVNLRKGRDTNNIYKLLLDCIESVGIIDNDCNILERAMYKVYGTVKDSHIIVKLFEPKGWPRRKDIEEYFFWIKEDKKLLTDMQAKTSAHIDHHWEKKEALKRFNKYVRQNKLFKLE